MRGKNPTRTQRKFIDSYRLNSNNWLVQKDTPEIIQLVHRISGKVKVIQKPQK